MCQRLCLRARAKVNLSLDVAGLRPDGYHAIDSIMAQLALCDRIILTPSSSGRIRLSSNDSRLPPEGDNLAYRAAAALGAGGKAPGVHIFLDKRIPIAAGLGGGSADAAMVLLGLNRLWGLGLTLAQLQERASQLGSDVPYALGGGTARVTGRGERVEALPHHPEGWVVLARPPGAALSSGAVYRQFDGLAPQPTHYTPALLMGLSTAKHRALAALTGNALEPAVLALEPRVAGIKRRLLEGGAWGAWVSGSGPTVVGLVESMVQGAALVRALGSSGEGEALLTRFHGQSGEGNSIAPQGLL